MNRKGRRGSLLARLLLILVVTGMLPVLVFHRVLTRSYLDAEVRSTMATMETEALILMNQLQNNGYLEGEADEVNNALLDQMAENWNGRIRIVDTDFRILRDTMRRDEYLYCLAPEVLRAMKGEYNERYDAERHTLCFVEPIMTMEEEPRVAGVVLVNANTMNLEKPIRDQQREAYILEIIIFLLILLVDILLLIYMLRPFKRLEAAISKAADGSMTATVNVTNYRETQKISDAMNRTLARLKALDETRQEFVSNVAHELKTPITSIRVLADSLISMGEAPVELYQEFMGDISQEIDRESKIIDDLLSLSRLDNNAISVNMEHVNVNEKMELILKRLTPIAKQRNIELLFESFRPVIADIDEVKLTLAVTNLVENAIKYNNDGGWVKVSLNADYQFFYIKVSDSGVGIPEDALEHVFERFYRVDKARSRATGGTGLGLAITKSIVTLHHGEVKVYSKLGEGTTFVIRIPLHYISEEEEV